MILTHGASSIKRGGSSVIFGGITYNVVKIGNLLWTIENLKKKLHNWRFILQ